MFEALRVTFQFLGFSTPFLYAAATYSCFRWIDKKASGKAKLAVSNWLKASDKYDRAKVASALVESFDRLYGYPLLSWHTFLRSIFISIVVTVIVLINFPGLYGVLLAFSNSASREYFLEIFTEIAKIISFGFFMNIISDYISLFIVRFWLNRAKSKPFLALLGAPFAGAMIIVAVFYIQFVGVSGRISNNLAIVASSWKVFASVNTNIYAAILVHAWLPLFALAVIVTRGAISTKYAASKVQWFLKRGQHHPFEAIGIVAAAIVLVIAAVIQTVR